METRALGPSDVQVSVVGVGCNNFGARIDADTTKQVIDAAIDVGITFFDTAESYGDGESETLLGRYIGDRRNDVVIATKFGWWNDPDNTGGLGRPEYVRSALEASLARLRTDYVDLYQYHRPDRVTPLEETLGAMAELVQEGKVRAIGASNMTAHEVRAAVAFTARNGSPPFASVQNEYSWLSREAEQDVLPACAAARVAFIPYFPLANGLLTGKYVRGRPAPSGTRLARENQLAETTDATWEQLAAITAFAEREGIGLLELAIGGLAAVDPIASVIAGASSAAQVRANAAAGAWVPTGRQLQALRAL
jgi:aryl-alcohol dehydrogenase-like predicted oxidoreductase